ncbi:MAG: hypothetical protein ABSH26_00445 [Opitutaceae bacterium]|jgi:hypothetical protein
MRQSPAFRNAARALLGWAALFASPLYPSDGDEVAAVSSRVSSDYSRPRLADGSFAPEAYVFAQGGAWKGARQDPTIDKLGFLDVAHMIAVPLAEQNYVPARDPRTTRLLIMVYWGTTRGPENSNVSAEFANLEAAEAGLSAKQMDAGPPPTRRGAGSIRPHKPAEEEASSNAQAAVEAEDRMREQDDFINVKMLGYDSWWEASAGDRRGTALERDRQDLLSEIEQDRYFVVLMAYDFQLLYNERKHKLLWETRFSMRQQNHEFDKDLAAMARYASQYFGQDSHGLVHKEIPLGRVDIGDVKSLGEVPGKPGSGAEPVPAKPQ